MILRNEWRSAFHCCHLLFHLVYIRDLKIVNDTLRWLFGVSSEVCVSNQVIKACLSFPPCFRVFLLFKTLLVLIDNRERKGQEIFRVGIEVAWIAGDLLP